MTILHISMIAGACVTWFAPSPRVLQENPNLLRRDRVVMDVRFSRFEIFTGAGTLLLCLFFVCVFSEYGDIEESISAAVNEAVASPDLYWASVDANGQSVVLTGAAPDLTAKRAALHRARSIIGVTGVTNNIRVIGEDGTCQQEMDQYLGNETVRFKSGKADVADASFHVISMLASVIRNCHTTVEIAGHTDAQGDAEVNLRLSQRRADTVAKLLVAQGVPAARVRAVGYGETQPVATNNTPEGRSSNRRIEFRVLGEAV